MRASFGGSEPRQWALRGDEDPVCGRFSLTSEDYEEVAGALESALDVVLPDPVRARLEADHRPRFNVSPEDEAWLLAMPSPKARASGARWALARARWGFSRPDASGLLINARSESAADKPTFRRSFAEDRCLILADGFYEWAREGAKKQPLWFHPSRERTLLFFAGLRRREADGPRFTILTTAAAGAVDGVHERMPALIEAPDVPRWLDSAAPHAILHALLEPDGHGLQSRAVSTHVNDPKHDDPACLEPPRDLSLFD